jgi:uncharacterized membrane protein YqjE
VSAAADEPVAAPAATGLVREVASLAAAALVTRGELAAVELTEARDRAARWLLLAIAGGVLLLAALLTGSMWIVSLFWDTHRSAAAAAVALVYAVLGGGLMWRLVGQLRAAPPLLQSTLAELRHDAAALRGVSRGSR